MVLAPPVCGTKLEYQIAHVKKIAMIIAPIRAIAVARRRAAPAKSSAATISVC